MMQQDFSKFLDENNIIKRDEVLQSDISNFDVNIEPSSPPPIPPRSSSPPPSPKKSPKPPLPPKPSIKKPEMKTKRQLIIEMMEKIRYQMLSKEVDYEVYQIMQQQYSNNQNQRETYQQNMLNVRKDHKQLEQKLKILQQFLDKEKDDG